MSDSAVRSAGPAPPGPGLAARIVGVIFSPREAYAAVAARPRWFGVLAVSLIVIAAATAVLLSTEAGKQAALDQNVSAVEAFGGTVTDEMYDRMEQQMAYAPYTGAASVIVVSPLVLLIIAGILHVVFGMLMGGSATFKHVYAVVAHSSVIGAVQQVFTATLTYFRGEAAGANLAVFLPMLDEASFAVKLLESIDLFRVWSTLSLAIGLAVLYKRRTGPIATSLLCIYLVIALIIAFFRSGS
jgi:hypothetical protein